MAPGRRRAATTTRAVYTSLGSKDALIVGTGRARVALLAAKVAALPRTDDPAADLVAAGVSGFRAWALAYPALFRVTFQQSVTVPPEVRRRFTPAGEGGFGDTSRADPPASGVRGCGDRTLLEATWQFHSLCEGLAALDLRLGMLGPQPDSGPIWADALSALIAGWRVHRDAAETTGKPELQR